MNRHANIVQLGDVMADGVGSTDPSKHPDETFVLYSIPAFDVGAPEVVRGRDIGSAKKNVQPNDVLLSRIVPHIRRSWIVGEHEERLLASGEWIVFRDARIHPPYLRHFLTSDLFHRQFMMTVAGVGGSLLRARPADVARIALPLPPLDEQRRIAAILDKADALRQKRKRAIALLDSLTQSIFLEMFGDPVNAPSGSIHRLADVASFIGGATPSKANEIYWTGELPWVSPKDMKRDEIYDAVDHVSEFALAETALRLVPSDATLIVVRGMILAHTFPTAITRRSVTINQDMKAIVFGPNVLPEFGYWNVRCVADFVLSKVSTAAHGTKRLEMTDVEELPVIVPSPAEQQRFLVAASASRRAANQALTSLQALDATFASLQHRAFSGQL